MLPAADGNEERSGFADWHAEQQEAEGLGKGTVDVSGHSRNAL